MKKNIKGFTLIELLAVIVILGVLLVVAVPAATSIINSSKKKSFESAANLAIENVETVASIEKLNGTISKCYVLLSNINLERGNFGNDTNVKGYVLVEATGKGKIWYSNGEYITEGAALNSVKATKTTNAVEANPSDIPECTWYE